ncbi:MAG: acetyl-CoA carboxylase biotin carboxyl carrier protein [Mycobacterium leprae]
MLDLDGMLRVMAAMRANAIGEVIITHDRVELRAAGLQPHPPAVAVGAPEPVADPGDRTFTIKAPMPGVIHCHPASLAPGKPLPAVGDRVEARAVVAILEAMKMNNEILAAKPGIIRQIQVENGQNVKMGQVLLVLAEVPG